VASLRSRFTPKEQFLRLDSPDALDRTESETSNTELESDDPMPEPDFMDISIFELLGA
jgi:hypothetical protein